MTRLAANFMTLTLLIAASGILVSPGHTEEGKFGTPKGDEGTRIFKAMEHPHYTGEFRIKGERATLIGSMHDTAPWDHLDYAGKHLIGVKGTIEIEVNEHTNTGRVVAEFVEGTDRYRVMFDRFSAKAPFQSGGIATRIYEHGDSNNGDPLYPNAQLPQTGNTSLSQGCGEGHRPDSPDPGYQFPGGIGQQIRTQLSASRMLHIVGLGMLTKGPQAPVYFAAVVGAYLLWTRQWRAALSGSHAAGIGLAVVKQIIEAHGSRVLVDSEPGQGATFRFVLPTAG